MKYSHVFIPDFIINQPTHPRYTNAICHLSNGTFDKDDTYVMKVGLSGISIGTFAPVSISIATTPLMLDDIIKDFDQTSTKWGWYPIKKKLYRQVAIYSINTDPISINGDSGSLFCRFDKNSGNLEPCGLLVAGNNDMSVITPITSVLTEARKHVSDLQFIF